MGVGGRMEEDEADDGQDNPALHQTRWAARGQVVLRGKESIPEVMRVQSHDIDPYRDTGEGRS